MPTPGPTPRPAGPRPLRRAAWAAAWAAVVVAGCRHAGGGGSGGGVARGDPLLGDRIPKQNLPIPGRDGYGTRDRRDPLLGAPAGRDGRDERAGKGDPGTGQASRGPVRPSRGTTNAALAAGGPADPESPAGTPASVPFRPRASGRPPDGRSFDRIKADVEGLGGSLGDPVQEAGEYVAEGSVRTPAGTLRGYTGTGPTREAAAQQVLDQIRGDADGR